MYRYLFVGLFFTPALSVMGQQLQSPFSNTDRVTSFHVTHSIASFKSDSLITAIAIKSLTEGQFSLIESEEKVLIPSDPDSEEYTYFLSLEKPSLSLTIEGNVEYDLFLIKSGNLSLKKERPAQGKVDTCDPTIDYIPQEEANNSTSAKLRITISNLENWSV